MFLSQDKKGTDSADVTNAAGVFTLRNKEIVLKKLLFVIKVFCVFQSNKLNIALSAFLSSKFILL